MVASGIGLFLALVAGALMWHGHGKKLPAWLMLLAGLFGAYVVTGWLGSILAFSILGLGVGFLVATVGGLAFWIQVTKNKKHHPIGTPILGLVVGVALMATFGGVRSMVGSTSTQLTNVTNHLGTTSSTIGRP